MCFFFGRREVLEMILKKGKKFLPLGKKYIDFPKNEPYKSIELERDSLPPVGILGNG